MFFGIRIMDRYKDFSILYLGVYLGWIFFTIAKNYVPDIWRYEIFLTFNFWKWDKAFVKVWGFNKKEKGNKDG